jgi:hypothetical protein
MKDVIKTFAYIEFDRATRTEPEYSTDGFANTFTDDQARWIVSYLQGYVNIDHQCKFGQTLWGVDKIPSVNNKDIYIGHGVLLNLEHQTRPFILHGNGSANYDEIYKQMIL